MNDYWQGDDFICGRCKQVICKDDGTCGCVGWADGDRKVLVYADGSEQSWEDAFVHGFELARRLGS